MDTLSFKTISANKATVNKEWVIVDAEGPHGGLECGIFLGKRPDLDCVSCGPDVLDIHSYNERLDIASTQRSWEFLKLVLKNCK